MRSPGQPRRRPVLPADAAAGAHLRLRSTIASCDHDGGGKGGGKNYNKNYNYNYNKNINYNENNNTNNNTNDDDGEEKNETFM